MDVVLRACFWLLTSLLKVKEVLPLDLLPMSSTADLLQCEWQFLHWKLFNLILSVDSSVWLLR